MMKNTTTHLLFRIHREGRAECSACILYYYRRKRYIDNDDVCRKCRLPYFFGDDVWMGGIRSCRDRPHHIDYTADRDDAHTHGLEQYIVGMIQLLETLPWLPCLVVGR